MSTTGLSTNPFRTPHLTPQHTTQSSPTATPSPRHPEPQFSLSSEGILDDAPPAYTPLADEHQGEAAVQFGPRRPFQPAPTPPGELVNTGGQPIGNLPHGEGTSGTLNTQQTSAVPHHHTASASAPTTPPASLASVFSPLGRPPPRHPSTLRQVEPLRPVEPAPPRSPTRLSPPPQQRYDPPSGPPPQRRFDPPPGAPPPPRFNAPPGPPPRHSASIPRSTGGTPSVPDGARPTTTPTPGHPLLRDGRTLVYPHAYTCHKCNNTGYKNFDPSHPCRKCWERFSKPYAGALVYAPVSEGSGGNFQRPLPTFRPPHAHGRVASETRYAPPPHSPVSPVPVLAHPFAPPPPGATVVQPGDPRIGGRLCWRCSGRGSVSLMIFDQETCEICKGMGRVFN